jgi:hypothetical protein
VEKKWREWSSTTAGGRSSAHSARDVGRGNRVSSVETPLEGKLRGKKKTSVGSGTDFMILKIFSPKKIAKKWAFLTENTAKLCEILIITLVFEKNANFFAENWQKSQKIVIITSTPDEEQTVSANKCFYFSCRRRRCCGLHQGCQIFIDSTYQNT